MTMKPAGPHKLTYKNIHGEYKVEYVTHVSLFSSSGRWKDITKVLIPEGKTAFVQCPACKSNDWSNDSSHLKGISCIGCSFEILVHNEEE